MTMWPSPSHVYIGFWQQPKGLPTPFFAIFSEFGPNQIFHLQIKFQELNIDNLQNIIMKIII